MENKYIFVSDIRESSTVPENGILSKSLFSDANTKIIQFTFAPGQELSAHTAPYPATLYFARGEATVKLGEDVQEAREGTFVYMTPLLEHGIKAKTEVVMVLTMVKAAKVPVA